MVRMGNNYPRALVCFWLLVCSKDITLIILLNIPTSHLRYNYNPFPDDYGEARKTVEEEIDIQ